MRSYTIKRLVSSFKASTSFYSSLNNQFSSKFKLAWFGGKNGRLIKHQQQLLPFSSLGSTEENENESESNETEGGGGRGRGQGVRKRNFMRAEFNENGEILRKSYDEAMASNNAR